MRNLGPAVVLLVLWTGTAVAQQEPRPDVAARRAAQLAAGDSAWSRADHPAAFVAYDAVVRADSAASSRALFRVGLLHAWLNRFAPAIAAFRLYVVLEPADLEGRVALARTLAWANRFPQSLAEYDTVLGRDASYRDAVLGRAQTLAWADRIPEAEEALELWLATRPTDVEAWTLLGQFRRWRGALHESQVALERALAVDPAYASAAEQLAWVRAEARPAALVTIVNARDSEDNHFFLADIGGTALTRGGVRYTALLRHRSVDAGPLSVVRTIPGAHLIAQWDYLAIGWTFRGDVGVVDYTNAAVADQVRARFGLRGAGRIGRRVRLTASVGREPFDEVSSTALRAMMFTLADLDVAFRATPRLSLNVSGTRGFADGGGLFSGRTTALGAVRFVPRRSVQLALSHRYVSWDQPEYGIFFAPQDWHVSEASAGWERSAVRGLVLAGELAVGVQGVSFEGASPDRSVSPRATMRLGWRPKPGREILAAYTFANVAGAGAITASDYRYTSWTLGGRWTF